MVDRTYAKNSLPRMSRNISSEYTGILHDIPRARFKLESERLGEYRRLWILVMEFLTPYDIIGLRRVSKLVYLVTFEQEVWRSVMINYYMDNIFEYRIMDKMFLYSVRKNRLIVKKLSYSFLIPYKEPTTALFSIQEQEFRMCEDLTLYNLIEIQRNYRDICYAIMKFDCMDCRKYSKCFEKLFYYKSLRGYLCKYCISKPKYRLVTECEACFENGISASQFDRLKLDDEEGKYFDIIVKDRLNMLNKKVPITPKKILVEEPKKKLQYKQPKYINTRRHQYPQDIRNFKSAALKNSKKAR